MSFLDHFRKKPSGPAGAGEKKAGTREEIAKNVIEPGSSAGLKSRPVDPEEELARLAGDKPKPPPVKGKEEDRIRFCVGDFLHRIPHQLLKQGPHDITFEICFDAADVADRIAQGHTTIALVEVYKRAPHIFRGEIRESDNIEIRFPWQKLMSFIRPDAGAAKERSVSAAAANTLAARVRSRKQERRPAPSEPGGVSGGAFRAETAPSVGSKGLRQPSRYTKPGDKPPHIPGTAIEPATPVSPAPVEAITVAAAPTNETNAVNETTKIIAADAVTPASTEPEHPQLDLGLPPQQKVALPERAREQVVSAVEVSQLKAEHARQLSALMHERDFVTAERSRLQMEIESLRKHADDAGRHLEEEKNLAVQRQDELTRADNARADLQKEIDSRAGEISELRTQIAQLKSGNEEAVKSVVQERDALIQQKSHLSEQLAKFRHGRPATFATPEPAGDPTGRGPQVERSKREYQRQIEELQRRITAFESSQKESAHELTRERESRIKVERALAAAERARAEATALVENMRTETRRDLENGLRKRESEFARMQQEFQEQLDAANRASEAAKLERQQLLAQITELQTSAASEREKLRARIAELENSAHGTDTQTPIGNDWESRAVASLESDVEDYRNRIKTLLQERDSWSQERARLTQQLHERATGGLAPAASANDLVREGTVAQEKLQADLDAATAERDRLAAQLRTAEQAANKAEHASSRLDALIKERDEARGELTRARGLIAQTGADHQLQLAAHEQKHDALLKEKNDALRQLEEIKSARVAELRQHETQLQQAAEERAALEAEQQAARAALASQAENGAIANELRAAIKAREEAIGLAKDARAFADEAEKRLESEKARREQIEADANARLERELDRHRLECELLQRQRDELRVRLSRMIAGQMDSTEDLASPSAGRTPRTDLLARILREVEADVIDITPAEIVNAPATEANIHLPQIRPVQTRPPEVRAG